ncbi:MAG TPA: YqgE/AlgH family protein [Acidimicrobiales bacterium]|nr:YqgE/AlgH family protein [Acidimicrobiales bacterium]
MPEATLVGKLLVANPRLTDPNFDRTVVLVLVHGEDGALGVVINRPSDTDVVDALPQWADRAVAPARMFLGGPVSHDSVICLARVPVPAALEARAGDDVWRSVSGDLGTLDLDTDSDRLDDTVTDLRIFVGYAGWSGGQLEEELIAGGWWVLDSLPDDPFTPEPLELWHRVLHRQGGELALVALYPPDLSVN